MILGMFGGCFCRSAVGQQCQTAHAAQPYPHYTAIIGGIIAGFGARLAMGCNHGGVLYRNSTVLAARGSLCHRHCHWFMVWRALYPAAHLPYSRENAESFCCLTVDAKPDQARRRFRLGMLVFFGMLGWALLTAMNQPKLGLAMLFGVGFGLLIERAQICFTSAFRDMWITGRTHMAKAIIISMAVKCHQGSSVTYS